MRIVVIGAIAGAGASLLMAAGCSFQDVNQCQADLGVSWAPSACISAVDNLNNQTLVKALGDQACLRAESGITDAAMAKVSCDEGRAKVEKAAWVQIERAAAHGGGTPNLTVDELAPGLPAIPRTLPAVAAPSAPTSVLVLTPPASLNTASPRWASVIVPVGRWVIITPDGRINGGPDGHGLDSLEQCQRILSDLAGFSERRVRGERRLGEVHYSDRSNAVKAGHA
jgi:hypothetical protein